MPIEREPASKVRKDFVPPNSTPYRVKDGDSWVTIASAHGMEAWDLIEANFKTRSAPEVNWYLHYYVGCNKATPDGKNWKFSTSAKPGVIHIPKKAALYYVVPNMKLIPQDKDMSCWFASGQMLISWRQNQTQMCEIAHPDPALVKKWDKLYDDNPGINNSQIADFAKDLGLKMMGAMTPTPEYMRELLQRHGPLWVNGKSHITVIAGIRSGPTGTEVLVFDPAKPSLPNGAWRDFFDHYGIQNHTSLDAGASSETSMLYLGSQAP
jgi:hypothetical protein